MADVPITPIDLAAVVELDQAVLRTTGSEGYGLTQNGFVPKPFARLLTEKLALARGMLGADLDLTTGSVLRKLLELSALEDARTWSALGAIYDAQFVGSATGEALSRLGEELGLARPFLQATGEVTLTFRPPAGRDTLTVPNGARMSSAGGHPAATAAAVVLTRAQPSRTVPVVAFIPGPEHNLDPAVTDARGGKPMALAFWNLNDPKLEWEGDAPGLTQLAQQAGVAAEAIVGITHTRALSGGEAAWSDAEYRQLLKRAPRSIWTAEALRIAASLVPGVRQAQVIDQLGVLDVALPLFGNFNFGEALFASGRDLATPYQTDLLIAPTASAIWDGPDGLKLAIASVIEDLRPVGIGVNVRQADQLFVGIEAKVSVDNVTLPRTQQALFSSPAANELKQRLLRRVAAYVDGLRFGEPVRHAEVVWAMMNEPGVTDVTDLHLLRFPPLNPQAASVQLGSRGYQRFDVGVNVSVAATQIAVPLNDDTRLVLG